MRVVIGLVIASVLAAAAGIFSTEVWRQKKREERITATKAALLKAADDPISVQWKDSAVFVRPNAVCGEVNAKNSKAGYIGFKRYIAKPGSFFIEGSAPHNWDFSREAEPSSGYFKDSVQSIERNDAGAAHASALLFQALWKNNCEKAT